MDISPFFFYNDSGYLGNGKTHNMLHSLLIKECRNTLNKHAFIGMLTADFWRAFSSIDHELLFVNLEHCIF